MSRAARGAGPPEKFAGYEFFDCRVDGGPATITTPIMRRVRLHGMEGFVLHRHIGLELVPPPSLCLSHAATGITIARGYSIDEAWTNAADEITREALRRGWSEFRFLEWLIAGNTTKGGN